MLLSFWLLIADAISLGPPDDGFSPAIFFIMLCFFAVCLVLLGIGIVIGCMLVGGATVLVTLGIVSFSAIVAIAQRRFSAGLRALHYQLCAVVALPGGVMLLWFGSSVCALHLQYRFILIVGALAGVAAGLLLAAALDWFGRFARRRLMLTMQSDMPVRRTI